VRPSAAAAAASLDPLRVLGERKSVTHSPSSRCNTSTTGEDGITCPSPPPCALSSSAASAASCSYTQAMSRPELRLLARRLARNKVRRLAGGQIDMPLPRPCVLDPQAARDRQQPQRPVTQRQLAAHLPPHIPPIPTTGQKVGRRRQQPQRDRARQLPHQPLEPLTLLQPRAVPAQTPRLGAKTDARSRCAAAPPTPARPSRSPTPRTNRRATAKLRPTAGARRARAPAPSPNDASGDRAPARADADPSRRDHTMPTVGHECD
jgi:hypothetical protein